MTHTSRQSVGLDWMDLEEASTSAFSFAERPSYAVQLRLSPELREALVHAQSTGQAVSLKLGGSQVGPAMRSAEGGDAAGSRA